MYDSLIIFYVNVAKLMFTLAGRWRESPPGVRVDVILPAVSPPLKAWVTNVQLLFRLERRIKQLTLGTCILQVNHL